VKIYTVPNTVMFFLNERTAPFGELAVRRAVEYSVDRSAITRLFGGLAAPTENLFPSYWSSYRKISDYTYDLDKARQLIKGAGASGAPVTVWSDDRQEAVKVNTYLVNQLNAIGLKAKLKVVSFAVYYQTVGNQKTKAQVVWANFFADYPHPLAKIDQLFNGQRILQTGNYNFGNVDFPEINDEIEALKKEPVLTSAVAARWARVDRQLVVDKAAVVPVATASYIDFFGPSIDPKCYVNSQVYLWDFSRTCQK
jgi:ABC-type transport system substrate-binding protein